MEEEKQGVKDLKLQHAFYCPNEVDPNIKWVMLRDAFSRIVKRNRSCHVSPEYCAVSSVLLKSLKPNLFKEKSQELLFDQFFVQGIPHDAFSCLVHHLSNTEQSYQQMKILDILELFIRTGNFSEIFESQCFNHDPENLKFLLVSDFWEKLVTFCVSLPDRVANVTKGKPRKIFSTEYYIPMITSTLWKLFCTVHSHLMDQKDCSLEFVGKLVGRMCTAGHAGIVVKQLTLGFVKATHSCFVWRRISQNFITKIPDSSMETFLIHFLLNVPWYGYVEWILGEAVLNDQKVEYLLTVKFILIRQFKDERILKNVIGYLAGSRRRHVFNKVLSTLIHAWASVSAVRHQNFDQQFYVSSALMLFAGHLKKFDEFTGNKGLVQKVLDGVQMRLADSDASVRSLGLMVGENLVSALDKDAPKLEFEHDLKMPLLKHLQELLVIAEEPENLDDELIDLHIMDYDVEHLSNEEIGSTTEEQGTVDAITEAPDNLDSDDDLEPFDMSNDQCQDNKSPLYFRDCLDGLMEAENPDWMMSCLRSAEDLINSKSDNLSEAAVEMTKVLLHLENSFAMPDFSKCRHRALVALIVHFPAEVAKYLAVQFYERDYNIRQRLDMLEVIAAGSQELSKLKPIVTDSNSVIKVKNIKDQSEENWQTIVEKRLETKTKHFNSGRRPVSEPEVNIFGNVAGHFFFPLIEMFEKQKKLGLNLLGNDSYVLGRLLYTLGIVMHSSVNTLISKRMGWALARFLLNFRNHNEPFVRQAAIFAVTTVFITVPSYILISELQSAVIDTQEWLTGILEKDTDVNCQIRAAKALHLLVQVTDEEKPSVYN